MAKVEIARLSNFYFCHNVFSKVVCSRGVRKGSVCAEIQIRGSFTCYKIPNLSLKPYVVGTQKNHLTETILLSTHNVGFGRVIREIFFLKVPVNSSLLIFVVCGKGFQEIFTLAAIAPELIRKLG